MVWVFELWDSFDNIELVFSMIVDDLEEHPPVKIIPLRAVVAWTLET